MTTQSADIYHLLFLAFVSALSGWLCPLAGHPLLGMWAALSALLALPLIGFLAVDTYLTDSGYFDQAL